MTESFTTILTVGNHRNSLGRAGEVVTQVLANHGRLDELYDCLFDDDAWLRMRAIDSLEKVCSVHPDWLEPYVDRLLGDVAGIDQASIQWHLAQMFGEIELSSAQRAQAIKLMKQNLADSSADWIVASNTMKTLAAYVHAGYLPAADLTPLLALQQTHRSKAVVKRASALLAEITAL